MQTTVQSAVEERLQIIEHFLESHKLKPEKIRSFFPVLVFGIMTLVLTGHNLWFLLTGQYDRWEQAGVTTGFYLYFFDACTVGINLWLLYRHRQKLQNSVPKPENFPASDMNQRFQKTAHFGDITGAIRWPGVLLAVAGFLKYAFDISFGIWPAIFTITTLFMVACVAFLLARAVQLQKQIKSFEEEYLE